MVNHMIFVFLLILAFYGVTNYYIGNKLFKWFQHLFPKINRIVFGIIYSLFALTTIINFVLPSSTIVINSNLVNVIGQIGEYWMGIYFYMLLLLIIMDIILFIGSIIKLIPAPVPKSIVFHTRSLVIITVIGLVLYGVYNANQIREVSYEVQIDKDTSLDNLNVVLISDLHLGYINDVAFIADIVDRINALQPDVVLMSGDIFNGNYYALSDPSTAIEELNSIKSTYGVYASLGNHDAGRSYDKIVSFIEKSNIHLLNDEHIIIDNKFVLIGRKDSSPIGEQGTSRGDVSGIFNKIDKKFPVIVMDHQPANMIEYGNEVDLIVSGHTHQGQVFPANLITNAMFTVDYGYYQKDKDSPQVIVTSGVGTWGPPLRIGTNSEIVQITID
ncbi:serine/threonine protein phosphatase [Paenibacillus antarcticus]|uniref:Serine/threonine protein phosphatase n=2 Tax=Paenibacillus antarcticus TaxID=253703 RepID=A0A168JCQ6_9BACL|nr:serine/threonine protein phosphatase [Paenibacillus antarcticus]